MVAGKMFEVATRNKMRFPFRGLVSAEDLWDLSLTNLDSVFKTLNSQVKKVQEESLLATKSAEDEALILQINIVKYIVSVKQAEAVERLSERENKEKKQKIMAILADKQDTALKNMSEAELQKMLDSM